MQFRILLTGRDANQNIQCIKMAFLASEQFKNKKTAPLARDGISISPRFAVLAVRLLS
jgi:hypothetical protein